MALPALFNICILLFLVVFIYAIFGMALFKNVLQDPDTAINESFNFEDIKNSLLLLFQVSETTVVVVVDDNDEIEDWKQVNNLFRWVRQPDGAT